MEKLYARVGKRTLYKNYREYLKNKDWRYLLLHKNGRGQVLYKARSYDLTWQFSNFSKHQNQM